MNKLIMLDFNHPLLGRAELHDFALDVKTYIGNYVKCQENPTLA